MSEKRVLTDFAGYSKFQLNEDGNGKWVLEGEFGRADIPTANGRVYPRKIWEREIQKIAAPMADGTVLGHLNHPKDGKTDLKEVSHVMKALRIEPDGRVMGRAELCDNQWGDQYKAIHKAGGKVGVSSRGMGSTEAGEGKYAGHEVVAEDYEYMTHDLVADPAVKTSYPNVKEESKIETKEIVMEKVYSEADVQKKLDEQKEAILKQIKEDSEKEKLALAAEPAKSPVEPKLADQAGEVSKETEKAVEASEKEDEKALKEKMAKTESMNEPKASVDDVKKAMELVKGNVGQLKARGGPIEHAFAHTLKVFKDRGEYDGTLASAIEAILRSGYEIQGHEYKDEEIASLKAQIESKDKEIAALVEGAKEITEAAKKIGLALMYEQEMGAASLDRAELMEEVGPIRLYKSEEQLSEAIKKGKKKIADKKKAKMEAKKKMEAIEAKHKEELKRIEEEAKKAKDELLMAKKQLAESLEVQKKSAASVYVEQSVKGHPNAQNIRKLCEGITEKKKIDEIVKQLSIDESAIKEYSFIQNRLNRLEAIKNDAKAKSLVENQLGMEVQTKRVEGDVDAEIAYATGEKN